MELQYRPIQHWYARTECCPTLPGYQASYFLSQPLGCMLCRYHQIAVT